MSPGLINILRAGASRMGPGAGKAIETYLDFSAYKEFAKEAKNEIKTIFDSISRDWIEMQDIAFQTGRSMAMSREMAMRYDRQLMQTTKELARQYGITAKEIAEFQKAYTEATGRNVILTRQQTESLAALQKIAGNVSVTELVDEFDKVGVGVTRATANIGLLQERAKALGISPAKATKMMADNIRLASSYSFRNGLADIEKMALKSASMRMDMDAIMSASERFSKIGDAIETSANIQMLGGSFAREFSNPMGALYESMADPKGFQERLLRTVEGKGRYDQKTGQVTFDPVTMMQMRAMADQLGISVDKLTNPAMAQVQNQKVEEELRDAGTWGNWSKVEREAIMNLSRNNVDEATGKHQITYTDVNGDLQTKNIEDLTREELQIAQDRQMTEENLFKDVQDIKDILEKTLGRARGTTSTKENITGFQEEINSFIAQFQNMWMGTMSGWMNGSSFQPWDLVKGLSGGWGGGGWDIGTHATEGLSNIFKDMFGGTGPYAFSQGGVVEPLPHAALGTIIPGDSHQGDRVPVMANSGEMILNKGEQKGLFDLLKRIATTGAMIWGGNKLGKHFGMSGLGTNAALNSLFMGGGLNAGGMLGSGAAMVASRKMMGGMMNPMGMTPYMSGMQHIGLVPKAMPPMITGMTPMGISPFGRFGMGMRPGMPITLMNPTVMMNGQTIMNGSIGDGSIVDQLEDIVDTTADVADTTAEAARTTKSFSMRLRDLSKKNTFLGRRARELRNFKASRIKAGRRISNGRIGHFYRNRVADAKMLKARSLDWYDNSKVGRFNRALRHGTFDQRMVGSNGGQFRMDGKLIKAENVGGKWTQRTLKAKGFFQQFGRDIKSLFKSGTTASTTKAAKTATKAVGKVGKASKFLSGAGKALGSVGRLAGPIGTVLAVGSAIGDISAASSQYDARVREIESSGASDMEKARAKDAASKEKNASIGSGVGSAAGAALGGTLGMALGPLGAMAGAWLGSEAGGLIGKGIGGLFGGGEEKKLKKEKEAKEKEEKEEKKRERNKSLESIEKNVAIIAGRNPVIGAKALKSPSIKNIGGKVVKSFLKSTPLGLTAEIFSKSPIAKSIKENVKGGVEAMPIVGNFLKVNPTQESTKTSTPTTFNGGNINLDVSGTIKLEGNGKSVDFDLAKLLETESFKRELANLITRRVNEMSNAGKVNMESARNNMASQYNKTGK